MLAGVLNEAAIAENSSSATRLNNIINPHPERDFLHSTMRMKQMTPQIPDHFEPNHQRLLNCLKLGGLQPKTIELCSHGVRHAAAYFNHQIDDLTKIQLTDYFVHIFDTLSWSTLKNDLYGCCTCSNASLSLHPKPVQRFVVPVVAG